MLSRYSLRQVSQSVSAVGANGGRLAAGGASTGGAGELALSYVAVDDAFAARARSFAARSMARSCSSGDGGGVTVIGLATFS